MVAAVAAGALAAAGQGLHGASAAAPGPQALTAEATFLAHEVPTVAAPEVLTPLPRPAVDEVEALGKAVHRAEHSYTRPGVPYRAGDNEDLDGWIAQALGLMGLPQTLASGVKTIILRESGGDPDAINLRDSNARAGHPSEGLMQVIPVTFRSSVLPSLADRDITDPVANITAGVRAMIANHGIETVMDGGRRNAAGEYIGYGGARSPGKGLPEKAIEFLERIATAS